MVKGNQARSKILEGMKVFQFILCIWNEGARARKFTGKWKIDYRILNKIVFSLYDGHACQGYYFCHFKGVLT